MKVIKRICCPSILVLPFASFIACADNPVMEAVSDNGNITEVYITGGKLAIETMPGSATLLDEGDINTYLTTDINSLLGQVAGVYIRQEDGYGLRPNIGLRGTSSERSTKITLMEDGILIAPAPYAAPAAYYTPNVANMSAVEVFKGPSAVRYGPHTVGGAINFVTRPVSKAASNELELAVGEDGFHKARGFGTYTTNQFGFWVDALSYGADGFKNLDSASNSDTGFTRNNISTKLQWHSREDSAISQTLQLKLGYADEDSNETYLGLSDDDFDATPLRRYSASQLDEFESEHTQIHVLYSADFNNGWKVSSKAWHNAFDRSWNKFNGFINGVDVYQVLANPNVFADDMDILRGDADSDPASSLRLDVTDNSRSYAAQGVELNLSYSADWFGWGHEVDAGIRFHSDYVERNHVQRGYLMQGGVMVFDGASEDIEALNRGDADAIALYVKDEILLEKLLITLGLRSESIETKHQNFLSGSESVISDRQQILLPGVGAFYSLNESFGLLLGINKGFSAKAASSDENVKPEESTNYEYGFRFRSEHSNIEIIGFSSQYTNLLGRCRIVDNSCDSDVNGGQAAVDGLEFNGSYNWSIADYSFPLNLVYTYTQGEFKTSFESTFNQWGGEDNRVDKGDELPYLPTHQGQLQFGVEKQKWAVNMALKHTGEMREEAGQGAKLSQVTVPALTTINAAFNYSLNSNIDLKFAVDNLTDSVELVSRRPIGARPNQPRTAKVGVRWVF